MAYKKKTENTLDLIEECLDQIYNVRKHCLQQRVEHNATVLQRQNAAEYIHNMSHTTSGKSKYLAEEDDYETLTTKELCTQLKTPSALALPPVSKQSVLISTKTAFTDPKSVLVHFNQEYKIMSVKARDDDELDDDCDYLTDKYFTHGLDLLPTSAETTSVKKHIAMMIEDMARGNANKHYPQATEKENNSKVPALQCNATQYKIAANTKSNEQIVEVQLPPSPLKKAKSVTFIECNANHQVASSGVNDEKQKDRGMAEKERIKQQYEQYMKLKRRNEYKKDGVKMKEYEELNSDIQRALNSMLSKPKQKIY
jgi:hypothetical protein